MEMLQWLGIEVPPGSESRACAHGGFPGTWEARCVPPSSTGTGKTGTELSRPAVVVSIRRRSDTIDMVGVRQCDEKGAWSEEATGVGTLRSTAEAGEQTRLEPVEGRRRR